MKKICKVFIYLIMILFIQEEVGSLTVKKKENVISALQSKHLFMNTLQLKIQDISRRYKVMKNWDLDPDPDSSGCVDPNPEF